MSDKIRIKSLLLENYRQYHGKIKVDFSSREEGFTIIAGKNGEGKSNLLNSISWCLYNQEPHGMDNNSGHVENKSLSVMNTRYIKELKRETVGRTSVKIWIEKGNTTYSISRVLSVLKHKLEFKELENGEKVMLIAQEADDKIPQGCEILPEQSSFVIKEKGPDDVDFRDTIEKTHPDVLMNEILPRGLSKYFLLDGEFLEEFWRDTSIIQNGVEQISQLHLLNSLLNHVSDMCIVPKDIDREVNNLSDRINRIIWEKKSYDEHGIEKKSEEIRWKLDPNEDDTYYHATGTPRMKELDEDSRKMKQMIVEISKKIGSRGSQNIEHLTKDKIELEADINLESKELLNIQGEYIYNLITKSPYVFLKKAIEDSVQLIEKRTAAGDLPIRQRRQFAEDLLKHGICICGESLDIKINDPAIKTRVDKITRYKDKELGSDDLDAAVDMKFNFKHEFIRDYNDFLKKMFGDPQAKLAKQYKKIDHLKYSLQTVNLKLKEYGGEEVESLIEKQQTILDEIDKKENESSDIKFRLKNNSQQLSELKIQRDKKWKQNQRARKLSHAYAIWNRIEGQIEKAYDELKDEIRLDVQNNTWKNFKELLENPSEFKSFTIDLDYSVYLLDTHNANKIYNLSAGQSLILTLAFVAAIRKPTGYRFPLVVDSPLGKIDGGNRYNIGMRLPEYLPGEQLTLLVTDTEYVAILPPDPMHPNMPSTSVAKLLEEKINLKHFKIRKENDGNNTGNSSISPAELKFDEKRKTWVTTSV